jgi:hypothetical protein
MQAAAAAARAGLGQLHLHPLAALAAAVQVDTARVSLLALRDLLTLAAVLAAEGKMPEPQEYLADLAL